MPNKGTYANSLFSNFKVNIFWSRIGLISELAKVAHSWETAYSLTKYFIGKNQLLSKELGVYVSKYLVKFNTIYNTCNKLEIKYFLVYQIE